MNFLQGHKCIFGQHCIWAHSINDVIDINSEPDTRIIPHQKKKLFNKLGIWPSVTIISYFSNTEIIDVLRRVNKEAHFICKRAYAARKVALKKINLQSVKFFERAEEIAITTNCLGFFNQFKDNFLEEIIMSYKNLFSLTINLNMLFNMEQRDQLLERLSKMQLKENIKTFHVENTELVPSSIETLTRKDLLAHIRILKLPQNNLEDRGT